ncbi:MAG TPA: Xaa-Pro peptidase family protein [Acidimicrobiales bacterium]|nr:Xaa-Pro peptidase family protein [Acidimicrobiales bacterium]
MTTDLAPLEVATRLPRLRAALGDAEVDALIVTTLANVRYLTGFSGSAGVVVVTESAVMLTTDGRYRTQSAEQLAAVGVDAMVSIEIGDAQTQRDAVRALVTGATASRIGLEADSVTWSSQRRWAELMEEAGSLVPTTGVVEALREVKDPGEIARMGRAAAIADAALAEVLPLFADAGNRTLTELEFALALDTAMRRGGAEDRAFDTIVAAGPNSAKPHHQPTERPIRPGDPVVVDFGAIFEGYRSDMTRTFCIGGPPAGELARVFAVVADSQAKGVAAVAPGMAARDVDQVCRDVIAAAGWAERFEHGTGHGVGLDIHEAPTVSPQGTAILAAGVVVTVEPGVYLPGIGGVRIEDTLVVTEDGSRPLTTFTKDVAA